MFRVQMIVREHEAAAAELLMNHLNACSITLAEPAASSFEIYEPPIDTHPMWPELMIEAYFEYEINSDELTNTLNRILSREVDLQIVQVDETDWQADFQQQFSPQIIHDRLCVLAPWHEPMPQYPSQFVINPGIAFGTGSHPTTYLCLDWLATNSLIGKCLLDYGCGSGILSLAAYTLGARPVDAIDIDPQALAATRANIALNQFPDNDFTVSDQVPDNQYDLIVANILFTPLVTLGRTFYRLITPGGKLVVSGILAEQSAHLIEAYGAHFHCAQTVTRDEWALIEFHRMDSL